MARSVTTDTDQGALRITALLEELKRDEPGVKAGILEGAGTHKDENGKTVTVAQIAIWQEFGTKGKKGKGIPKRPFMRYSALIIQEPMARLQRAGLIALIQGKTTIDQLCARMGELAKGEIKKVIVAWDTPGNAPSTILAKARKKGRKKIASAKRKDAKGGEGNEAAALAGFDNPLIDTSQMLNSVQWVRTKKGDE